MKSYKNWKMLNESFIPGINLGLSHPQSLGIQSNLPGFDLEEKSKKHGKVVTDDEGLDGDDVEECACSKKKGMKKKMKKHMDDDVEMINRRSGNEDGEDDDINDVPTPDDDDDDDDDHDDHDDDDYDDDDDHDDDDHDDDDHEDHDHEDHDDGDGDDDHHDDDDEGEDAAKFGFMKDKKSKKKKRKDEAAFWGDINANYRVPKNEVGTDEEFFDSLARQYGNPHVRFNGGVDRVDEDLLLSPEQQALIDAMPQPGEVGYAPVQRMGGGFAASQQPDLDYLGYGESTEYEESVEESADYEVLCKYFSEDVARELIEKKRSR